MYVSERIIYIPIRNKVCNMQPIDKFCKDQYGYLFHTMANVIPPIVDNLKTLNIDNFDDIQCDPEKAKNALDRSIEHIDNSFVQIPSYAETLIGISLKDLPEIYERQGEYAMHIKTSAYDLINGPTPNDYDRLKVLYDTLLAVRLIKGSVLAERDAIAKYARGLQVQKIKPIYILWPFSEQKPLFEALADIIRTSFSYLSVAEREILFLANAIDANMQPSYCTEYASMFDEDEAEDE